MTDLLMQMVNVCIVKEALDLNLSLCTPLMRIRHVSFVGYGRYPLITTERHVVRIVPALYCTELRFGAINSGGRVKGHQSPKLQD